jgi:hypothetical protein
MTRAWLLALRESVERRRSAFWMLIAAIAFGPMTFF